MCAKVDELSDVNTQLQDDLKQLRAREQQLAVQLEAGEQRAERVALEFEKERETLEVEQNKLRRRMSDSESRKMALEEQVRVVLCSHEKNFEMFILFSTTENFPV